MDNAIDELIAECGEILANPDSYNLVSEAKRIESALETVVPKVRVGLKMFRATIGGQSSYGGERCRRGHTAATGESEAVRR